MKVVISSIIIAGNNDKSFTARLFLRGEVVGATSVPTVDHGYGNRLKDAVKDLGLGGER
jgi:hypothetical protein